MTGRVGEFQIELFRGILHLLGAQAISLVDDGIGTNGDDGIEGDAKDTALAPAGGDAEVESYDKKPGNRNKGCNLDKNRVSVFISGP